MNGIIRTAEDIDPADRAELRVIDIETGKVKHYPSLVQGITEMGIAVSMPSDGRAAASIPEGASVEISIWKGYTDHRFRSRVLKRVEGRGLILSRPGSSEIVRTPRRQSFRVGTRISASVIHTAKKAPVRATILNLSAGGSRIETAERIHKQTPVVLNFDLPNPIGDSGKDAVRSPCQIAGVIKWADTPPDPKVAKASEDPPYVQGIGFTDVGNTAQTALLRYLAFRQRELIGQIVGAQSSTPPDRARLYEIREALGQTERQIGGLERPASARAAPDDIPEEAGSRSAQTAHRAVPPSAPTGGPAGAPAGAPSVTPPRGHPRNKTVLVADAGAEVRKILCQTLSNEGYHTVEASNGQEALNIARSVHIDLTVADRMLDGPDLVSALRKHNLEVPVIFMTDEIVDEEEERSAGKLVAGYLEKPVAITRFLQLTYRTLSPGSGDGKLRILVVEDEEDMRLYTSTLLGNAGFEVETAVNGQSSLRKAVTFKPDLILLDIVMPGMQGFEVCERLRARASTADIPILLLTAKNTPAYVHQAIALKADGYIVKPFDPQELVLRVRVALQRAQNR